MRAHRKETIYSGEERHIRTVYEYTRLGRGTGHGYARIAGAKVSVSLASSGAFGRWWNPSEEVSDVHP